MISALAGASLKTWGRAIRPFSFTASLMPVVVAAALAAFRESGLRWELLPLAALGSVLFHAGTNLVSDAGDFDRGVDREGTHGGSGVLVAGILTSRQVLRAGLLMFVLGAAIGVFLTWTRGATVLWIGLAGLAGGLLYGGPRVGYKYHALGDIMVFVLMGPLTVIGAYYVLAGSWGAEVVFVSFPVGCLVTAILCSNNLRDIPDDSAAGVTTMATLLGFRAAKAEYLLLVAAAYSSVLLMVVAAVVPPGGLLVFLSLPLAAKAVVAVTRAGIDALAEVADIDVRTAQLHLVFTVLFSVGISLPALV